MQHLFHSLFAHLFWNPPWKLLIVLDSIWVYFWFQLTLHSEISDCSNFVSLDVAANWEQPTSWQRQHPGKHRKAVVFPVCICGFIFNKLFLKILCGFYRKDKLYQNWRWPTKSPRKYSHFAHSSVLVPGEAIRINPRIPGKWGRWGAIILEHRKRLVWPILLLMGH